MNRQEEVYNTLQIIKYDLDIINAYDGNPDNIDEICRRQYRMQDMLSTIIDDLLTITQ